MADPYQHNITTLAKRLQPFMRLWVESSAGTFTWGRIMLIRADGGGSTPYPVTEAGLTDALAAASAGDLIWIPPGTITGNHTVPVSVGIASMGNNTLLTGLITFAQYTFAKGITFRRAETSGDELISVLGTDGDVILNDCAVRSFQSGSGNITGVKSTADCEMLLWNCIVETYALGSGISSGVLVDGGNADLHNCLVEASAVSGAKYDLYAVDGIIKHYHSRLPGPTPCYSG